MVDISNTPNLPATNPITSQEITEKQQQEADQVKYGPGQKAQKFSAIEENARIRLADSGFSIISEVLNQLEVLVAAKAASMNAKIEANKEKIDHNTHFKNLA